MITLLICTAHVLGLAIGFWFGRMVYSTPTHEFGIMFPKLSRTDAENAAGMVS